MSATTIEINRAPVLTLWIAVVAHHTGYAWDTSLTIGKVFAGLNAQAKGRLLGIYSESDGPSMDKPVDPNSVETYLAKAFGESLSVARETMEQLAKSYLPEEIGARAFGLYGRFRPRIASGQRGWGQKGTLDLSVLRGLAAKR